MASKDGIPTGTSVLDKCNKLFKARSKYEVELKDVYTELNAALQAENKRRSKIESLLGKAEEMFTKCINENSELLIVRFAKDIKRMSFWGTSEPRSNNAHEKDIFLFQFKFPVFNCHLINV